MSRIEMAARTYRRLFRRVLVVAGFFDGRRFRGGCRTAGRGDRFFGFDLRLLVASHKSGNAQGNERAKYENAFHGR